MDIDALGEILDELLPSFEALEIKNTAILQFLKDKGITTDDELAPYLETAGNASSVRWRATRVRMMSLISAALKNDEKPVEKQSSKNESQDGNAEKQPNEEPSNDGKSEGPKDASNRLKKDGAISTDETNATMPDNQKEKAVDQSSEGKGAVYK